MSTRKIPAIDLSDAKDNETLPRLERACHDFGFVYVRGHTIETELITRVRELVVAYFRQPTKTKLSHRISRDNYRGYIPAGFFSANSGDQDADHYEGYKLHFEVEADDALRSECDLYGPNKWPDEPADFRHAILEYWHACDRVAQRLLGMFAAMLGVDRDWFLRLFDEPLTNMTLLHYPPQDTSSSGIGIHAHKDTDALTILAADKTGGLMIRPRHEEEWLEIEPPDNALVVNIGDLLEIWSGGYFASTPHKVINKNGAERYSFPFFVVPRHDTVVEPLRTPQPGFDRPALRVGDVSHEVWLSNWPDAAPIHESYDPGTLQN